MRRDTGAIVPYANYNIVAGGGGIAHDRGEPTRNGSTIDLNCELATFWHGIPGVNAKIHHDLMNLGGVHQYARQIRSSFVIDLI